MFSNHITFRGTWILLCFFFLIAAGCEDKPPSQPSREPVRIAVKKEVVKKKIVRPSGLEDQKKQTGTKITEMPDKKTDKSDATDAQSLLEMVPEAKLKASGKEKDHNGIFIAENRPSENMYNPAGRIDPFAPLFQNIEPFVDADIPEDKRKRKRRVPQTPLEKIGLSQLRLVGVVCSEASGNRGLVEEASGKGYIIREGTYIGTNAGRVVQILPDKAIIEEETVNFLGKVKRVTKELKLQKASGE